MLGPSAGPNRPIEGFIDAPPFNSFHQSFIKTSVCWINDDG